MRIALVTPRYLPHRGGVETHVSRLAEEMATQGHEVVVLTQEEDRKQPKEEMISGVRVQRFQVALRPPAYGFAPALWRHLRRFSRDYSLVHAHNYHGFPALGAALFSSVPLILTPHYHGTGHRPLGQFLHVPYRIAGRFIVRRASRIICVSRAEAGLVRSHFPTVSNRVTVIPNGVDIQGIQQERPYPEERQVILSVGRLVGYKNVNRLIDAMPLLGDQLELVVIGEGPERTSLEEQALRKNVAGRVRFLGSVDQRQLHRWLRTASVYASMSSEEAFGLTLLEGLAGGARVLASDIPAHRETLESIDTAIVALMPLQTDAEGLAAALQELAGTKSPPRIAETLPKWKEVADKTLDVYRDVLEWCK